MYAYQEIIPMINEIVNLEEYIIKFKSKYQRMKIILYDFFLIFSHFHCKAILQ